MIDDFLQPGAPSNRAGSAAHSNPFSTAVQRFAPGGRARLGCDTNGDGRMDAFDTNQVHPGPPRRAPTARPSPGDARAA